MKQDSYEVHFKTFSDLKSGDTVYAVHYYETDVLFEYHVNTDSAKLVDIHKESDGHVKLKFNELGFPKEVSVVDNTSQCDIDNTTIYADKSELVSVLEDIVIAERMEIQSKQQYADNLQQIIDAFKDEY